MMREMIKEEIIKVYYEFLNDKVFGIDSFLVEFFKVNWSIVGDDMCKDIE